MKLFEVPHLSLDVFNRPQQIRKSPGFVTERASVRNATLLGHRLEVGWKAAVAANVYLISARALLLFVVLTTVAAASATPGSAA